VLKPSEAGDAKQCREIGIGLAVYVSIRYSERLAEAGIEPSVGTKGDSYDKALA
jgi:hypothetical protein